MLASGLAFELLKLRPSHFGFQATPGSDLPRLENAAIWRAARNKHLTGTKRMKKLLVSLIVSASVGTGLISATAAAQECKESNCRVEKRNCRLIVYPCGENDDGTVIMCSEEECDRVRVCDQVCPARPDEDPLPGVPVLPPGNPFPIDPFPINPFPF